MRCRRTGEKQSTYAAPQRETIANRIPRQHAKNQAQSAGLTSLNLEGSWAGPAIAAARANAAAAPLQRAGTWNRSAVATSAVATVLLSIVTVW